MSPHRIVKAQRRARFALMLAAVAGLIALSAVATVLITIQAQRRDGYVKSCVARNEQNSTILTFISLLPDELIDDRRSAILVTLAERAFPVIRDCQKYADGRV